ncbi:hypothetical protein ASG17_06945 [Brevundimonas sp. Leaf363]|uniref:hypothetical protein n=1 Tax=Brevundimonas sp. Leaf363 TaxID=1736353 RepID=UPI0007010D6B|nr:hypothetical protein [Brevundimonas sp. Leaf363]KQS55790.1 hypothetical protein ASG17_06945 [Brevundimonas sp. Leaf363]
MQVEILIDDPTHAKNGLLRALQRTAAAAGFGEAFETPVYRGGSEVLVMWGAGRKDHFPAWQQQRKAGGRCIGFDPGYWGRSAPVGNARLHIDTMHPTPEQVWRTPSAHRLGQTFTLREDADPAGPIMIVGMGRKAALMRGERPGQWEREKYEALRIEFPDRRIEYRPKKVSQAAESLSDIPHAAEAPIEQGLVGCSLVVCASSNVSLDACVAGVPVRCDGGFAHVLYSGCEDPTPEQRLDLLNRSTWWNWHASEAAEIWAFAKTMM